MKNFDLFVGIDWSGARAPVHTKSICVAAINKNRNEPYFINNVHHKYWSRKSVADWIGNLVGRDKRILIGIDCNFGYAQSVGKKQFGAQYGYKDLWQTVENTSNEYPNYFAGGFWQHEHYGPYFWSEGKQPAWFDAQRLRRKTEMLCGEQGYGWPESPFKLFSAKQVGKGGLAGMRMALDLKRRFGDSIAMWPFETNLAKEAASIVITEIYPRQFLRRCGHGTGKLNDNEALNKALSYYGAAPYKDRWITDHEGDAMIAAAGLKFLCGDGEHIPDVIACPPEMTQQEALREGWIFGVGDKT